MLQIVNYIANLRLKIFHPQRLGVQIIIVFHHQVLLVKNKNNYVYSLPGGGIKKYETPKEAAIREINEELGLENINPIPWGVYYNLVQFDDHIYLYILNLNSKPTIKINHLNNELIDARWFTVSELKKYVHISPAAHKRIIDYFNHRQPIIDRW